MHKIRIFFILLIGISFYCYEFFLRILTGAYQEQIVEYFHIQSHIGFSFLVSSYNITYLLMQIPAGILLDRFGSKKVLIVATLICGIGNILFIVGGFELAIVGRLLVGIGSSFAFIGVLKLTLENFDSKHFALVTSIIISLGTLAAAFSQNISVYISNYDISWLSIFIYSGVFAIPLAILFQILLPKQNQSIQMMPNFSKIFTISKKLLASKPLWSNATWAGLVYIPTVVLTSQYGVLYFKNIYGFDTFYSASLITALFMGWVVFSPLKIVLCERFSTTRIINISMLLAIAVTIIFSLGLLKNHVLIITFLFGAFSASQVLVWYYFGKICPKNVAAVGIAITNMIITLVTELGQLSTGAFMDLGNKLNISNSTSISITFMVFFILGLVMLTYMTKKYIKD
ncbi:MFS transporter [Francisella sp. Scap27]|uniref:MFS transporter n=1 Tax=Francisella sp. Scap27 TaxID=2589986 RepID=UPI0015B9E82D|nr:MFS transporter [Francisella sp. Scap27]QLE78969.1 MFS transporter [Francisella sp. Scap27]